MANTKKYEKELGQAKNNIGKNETGVLRMRKMDYFRAEIEYLKNIGVSTLNIWKIINAKLPEYAKISQSAFYEYMKKTFK